MTPRATAICWAAAACLTLLGLGLTVRSVRLLGPARTRLERIARDFAALERLRAEAGVGGGALEALEKLPSTRPVDPAGLADGLLPVARPAGEQRSDAGSGWTAIRREFVFGDVAIGQVMEFAARAEAQRPPWRMVRCVIRSAPNNPGAGQVTLTLEALEK